VRDETPTVRHERFPHERPVHDRTGRDGSGRGRSLAGPQRLAALIRARMHQLGWSLTTAAAETGLSVTTMWTLREGNRGHRPRPETLLKLAVGLQLTAEDIFDALGREDDERASEQRHAQIYKRLDGRSRVVVDALALRLLEQQQAADGAGDDAADTGAPTTIDLTAVRTLALPLEATMLTAGRSRR
jgi:transcriptional regulator with XRE-family HTH domain